MTTVQLSDRLRTALIALRDIEATIQATLSNSRKLVELHPAVRARAAEIEALASNHIDAILARLSSAGDDDVAVPADPTSARSDRDWLSHLHPVSSSLRIAYALLNEAIIGYSMISPSPFASGTRGWPPKRARRRIDTWTVRPQAVKTPETFQSNTPAITLRQRKRSTR